MISAKIEADSISPSGKRIITYILEYPHFIHPQLMAHRQFSRNASSSRAVPVKETLKRAWNDPVIPTYWGRNKPGMQADEELTGVRRSLSKAMWVFSGKLMCIMAYFLSKLGLHKQTANRIIEPWLHIRTIVTSTEFANFFELRLDKHAQPEIRELTLAMLEAMELSTPKKLAKDEWHLPFVNDGERCAHGVDDCKKLSVARCARVSYLNHDKSHPDIYKDIELHDTLLKNKHMSPFEHQATPLTGQNVISGNFRGWKQYRKTIKGECKKTFNTKQYLMAERAFKQAVQEVTNEVVSIVKAANAGSKNK